MRRESQYSEAEARALLQREEGQFLELKSLWDREGSKPRALQRRKARDLIAEYVAAFANADGGTLVLGVEDDGRPSGHQYPEDAIADFIAVPERRLRPSVACRVARAHIDGHEVLIFEVPNTPEAVMVEANGFPYRVGDKVVREPQGVINDRKQAYRRVGYENRFHAEATLGDLDETLTGEFAESTPFATRPPEEVLERYGFVHPQGSGWAVTNAALLLFGKPPIVRWHPRAGIRFFKVAGKERRHGAKRNVTQLSRIELPIVRAIQEAHRLAREQIRRSETLHDLFFRERAEYPEFAWQEAIVNAFAHRDYELQGLEIEVWFYEDRMEVLSPGDLVPPVTLPALRQGERTHASRNPLLVRALVELGIMREEGEGIPRMFDEMRDHLLRPPEIELDDGVFRLILHNEPIFAGPGLEWQRLVGRLTLSPAQRRVLLAHPEGFTNEDYRRLNDVDRDRAYREIRDMVSRRIITTAESAGRGAVYRVGQDLRQARSFLESRVPKLREHFRENDQLTNAEYRQLFRVTRQAAVRELGRLIGFGLLEVRGKGRGAHYLATTKLDTSEE